MSTIECESCKYDQVSCNAEMLYGTCFSKGVCKYVGERKDFAYSEFEPKAAFAHKFPPIEDMVTIPKSYLEELYKGAFMDGMSAFSWTFENESWVGAWRMVPMRLRLACANVIGMVGYCPEKFIKVMK
ncbi:hypothetical protein KAR91_80750 [Candidatus Pacearchaeota archaeon]|nr:hypothetical protein [Candidatus Pacearchaeota archaeon]